MEETQSFVNDTAYRIVRLQEDNMVLKPWVLMASLLLQNLEGLELSVLTEQTVWLRGLALSYAAFLDWPGRIHTSHRQCTLIPV